MGKKNNSKNKNREQILKEETLEEKLMDEITDEGASKAAKAQEQENEAPKASSGDLKAAETQKDKEASDVQKRKLTPEEIEAGRAKALEKVKEVEKKKKRVDRIQFAVLVVLCLIYIIPIALILINSVKTKGDISTYPFKLPMGDMFVGIENFRRGIVEIGFDKVFFRSLKITLSSVAIIIVCCSMTGWYITRVKSKITSFLYYMFVFSMIVPFQMVMYTLSYITKNFPRLVIGEVTIFQLCSPNWLWIVYLGFGAGLSVFMFCGFVKAIPLEIEEAAMMDGCTPLRMFFSVIFPILKPTAITVAILNAMWVWNDYLLPNMLLDSGMETIPIAIQKSLRGSYGSVDMGALMAMLVLTVIPIIVFYIFSQKYIIKGVVAGAVKG